jgi:hypothetical protein
VGFGLLLAACDRPKSADLDVVVSDGPTTVVVATDGDSLTGDDGTSRDLGRR